MASRRTAAAVTLLLLATGGAVYGSYLWSESAPTPPPGEQCTVALGESTDTLSAEQAANAALIAAASARLEMPARAATIGIATALQESSLRNIDHGDRDSLGLFQQRPSQGWGTVEEILDPYYSTDTFYAALAKVDGWQDMEVTVAAQTVQRSGFPDAYATREASARLWASALRGHSGVLAVTCDVSAGGGTTAQDFAARIDRDFGAGAYAVEVASATSEAIWLSVSGADATANDAFAAWAVAVAREESVAAVAVDDAGWQQGEGLTTVEVPRPGEGVAVRLTPLAGEAQSLSDSGT
ncbi:hypothetical protein Lsed01_00456 [Demequina sediminis]|uniref:Heavy metal transporter n=1 Tax=Demequina sediminis TaxID=1930058 RepID=A0ABP9WEQ0_9MICO|nr:hypothetical protein [Demequina sediminis]BDZ61809.1 hypothetical protein GCM10025873_16000 [Demequina sediminis]